LFAEIEAFYTQIHTCGEQEHHHDIAAIDISEWREVYIELAKKVHSGDLKQKEVTEDVVRLTYGELNAGAEKGYGKGWNEQKNYNQTKELQKNLYKFSCAKDLTVAERINSFLVKDGKIRDFESFKTLVLKENVKYNVQYLKTEYKTAVQATNMAKQWGEYERNKGNYPNLIYKTQADSKVRDTHWSIHDVIVPIDDDFWKSYYPPNGWNCRCYVQQTNKPATTIPEKIKNVPKEFENNVAVSGQVFKEDGEPHPYFALLKSDDNYKKAFEFAKMYNAAYKKIATFKNGSKIYDSIFSDVSDFEKNKTSAEVLCANHKDTIVKIRPNLEGKAVEGWTNPEYEINGLIADRVEPKKHIKNIFDKKEQIQGFIDKYNKQFPNAKIENKYAIFVDLSNIKINPPAFGRKFFSQLESNANNLDTLFIQKNDKSIIITKKDVEKGEEYIKDLVGSLLQ
jgi:SPP1 gp7 family putative phage head morphogenesis protein